MPKTIGVFAGLIPELGCVRLTYKGDWELCGGRVEEKEVKQKMRVDDIKVPRFSPLWLTVLEDSAKEIF